MRPSQRQLDQLRDIRITRHYTKHAEGSVLIECGDTKVICTATVEEKGQKKPARALPVAYTREPTQDGEREVTVRRSGDIRITSLAYHMPAATHPDTPALVVLGNLLGHAPGGRLHKALVESKLAAFAGAGAGAMVRAR